jgi:hypothetical protein
MTNDDDDDDDDGNDSTTALYRILRLFEKISNVKTWGNPWIFFWCTLLTMIDPLAIVL